jgi:hypothetical protein
MSASDVISAWLADNPETAPSDEEEARALGVLEAGMDAAGALILATSPLDFRYPTPSVYCNAPIRSRGMMLWAFITQADADLLISKSRRTVKKSTLIRRAHDAGILPAIMVILDQPANVYAKARWWSPDWPEVYYDDPDMVAMLTAVGADVSAITAPE